jgi:uncharacterized membrane protein
MVDVPENRTARRKATVTTADAAPSMMAIRGHPIHPMLIPFPIAFLTGALLIDVAFLALADAFFARMSVWLLGAGLVTGALAAVPGLVDLVAEKRARSTTGLVHAWGNGIALVLAALNLGVRLVGGQEAMVSPWGVTLSGVVALLLAVTGWAGGELSYRHLVGVNPRPELTEARHVTRE